MWMERLHPGVKDLPVGPFSHASGCMADKWKDTRFVDLLDMATGQFESPAYMADEDAARMRDFFVPDTPAQRLAFACEAYPRKQATGTRWVYDTPDPYLLGTVLQHALRRLPDRPQDALCDAALWPAALAPIAVGPTRPATTRT